MLYMYRFCCFFKQKTAYEMRISDWSSDVCSSDLIRFIKLHHLHIVEGSIMGVHYKRKPFKLFSLEEYADFLCEFIPLLREDVVIQRLFGLADKNLLIAPQWKLKRSEIQAYIDKTLESNGVLQGGALTDFSTS